MLPFTKRPGKDESADVVTKESAPERPRTVPPAAKSSPSADRPRLAMPSISDEEMTCLMPSKALTGAVREASFVSASTAPIEGNMRLGARVRHGKFGEGVVLNIEGQGAHARVHVNFERQGAKWLMLSMARLERI